MKFLNPKILSRSLMRPPSQTSIFPHSEPEITFPSASCTNASISETDVLPNLKKKQRLDTLGIASKQNYLPSCPCNLRPVKVSAIVQNLMCPIPEDVS